MSVMRRVLLLCALFVLGAGALPAMGDTLDGDLNEVAGRIDELSSDIGRTSGTRSELADEIVSTDNRMEGLLADLAGARRQLIGAQVDLEKGWGELEAIREGLQHQYDKLEATTQVLGESRSDAVSVARQSYMGGGHSLATVVFSANDVSDVALTIEYLNLAAEQNRATIQRLEALRVQEERQRARIQEQEAAIEVEVEELGRLEKAAEKLRGELEVRSAEVASELETQRELLDELDTTMAEFEGELASLEREQARIERLIAERQRQDGTAPGILTRPVPGKITSGFGPRRHPILGITRMHSGLDMNARTGDSIVAAGAGTVILASYNGGYGNTVVIDHGGGMTTLYAHQSRIDVSRGEKVKAGERIGLAGSTGLSTGAHLHFEVRINGKPVDPRPYL